MFVIIYGLTGTIGDDVRQYMIDLDYQKLEKLYYTASPKDKEHLLSDGVTVVETPEEVISNCDYHYTINDRIVGYNKKNFDTAVRGKDSLFTSLSSHDIEFFKRLKNEYGDYVTIIYVYMDNDTLSTVINNKYSSDESEKRLEMGKHIKEVYVDNVDAFDYMVIYGGENSVFNKDYLLKQIDKILITARKNEIALNSERIVQFPYTGTDDYIFISYAHLDSQKVLEKLFLMQREGYRVWYDSGIEAGGNWRTDIFEKIKHCKNFVLFVSENSVISEDVKIEIVTAMIFEKKIIIINIDNEKFGNTIGNMLYHINAIQNDSEDFISEISKALSPSTKETKKKDKE